jgi:diguanylate cyclase (GGDEF)-like protein
LLYADRVRFRYQMEGLSPDWVDAGNNREASFAALPHGSYRFRVAASLDGQQWREADTALPIVVKPFFYQTAWFMTLAILLSLATALALYRLRTHSLRVRQLAMEELVAQRTEELRLANEHLSRLSFVDELTGLANRRHFNEALQEEWRRASRAHTPLALVVADIDFFKRYNDQLGHPAGDRCLVAVAGVFLHVVGRAGDLAARYGGEEFIVLIPGADQAAALVVAERLRAVCEALALPHPASSVGPSITLSLGVAACVPSDERSIESLIAEADAALYRAKNQGRNQVR